MLKVISAPPLFDVPPEMTVEFDPEDVVVLRSEHHGLQPVLKRHGQVVVGGLSCLRP